MLNIDVDGKLNISINDLLGESVAVLGIKGSGKSNTAAVVAEELLEAGVPLCIIDIAGEYYGLKEKYQVLVAGKSPNVDVEVEPGKASEMAEFSLRKSMSVILDISGYWKSDRFDFLKNYLEHLWELAGELRRPYQIIVDESHNFSPQQGSTPVSEVLTMMATEGRKRGLGIVMIGQRSARIDKDILTQAGILFLHRVRHPADVSVYIDILPKERKWVKSETASLKTGQAIVMYGDEIVVAQMREQHTFHAGYTPGMADVVKPDLQAVDEKLLKSLQGQLAKAKVDPKVHPEVKALQDRVKLLESLDADNTKRIAELEEENRQLKVEVGVLSKMKLQVDIPQTEVKVVEAPKQIQTETIHTGKIVTNGNGVHDMPVQNPLVFPGDAVQRSLFSPALDDAPDDDESPEPDDAEQVYITPLARKRALNRQNKVFDKLLRQIVEQCAKHHREILKVLIDNPGQRRTLMELARDTGYSLTTVQNNPPKKLLDMGLIARDKKKFRSDEHHYWSTTRAYLTEHCPDLDSEKLIQRIMEKA